jgi:hypothetical protein
MLDKLGLILLCQDELDKLGHRALNLCPIS